LAVIVLSYSAARQTTNRAESNRRSCHLSDQRVNAADEQKVVQNQPTSCAGLRAGEIAKLTWPMVLDPSNAIGPVIELHG
jgi:hypothetical protein